MHAVMQYRHIYVDLLVRGTALHLTHVQHHEASMATTEMRLSPKVCYLGTESYSELSRLTLFTLVVQYILVKMILNGLVILGCTYTGIFLD